MKKTVGLVAIIILMVFVACENQKFEKTVLILGFRSINENNEIALARGLSGEGILIDTAVIILGKIDLKLQGEAVEDNSGNYIFKGPYVINLLTKKSEPELLMAEVIPGIYTKLAAELHVHVNLGYSIYISGTYTKDEVWHRFIYSYREGGAFEIEHPNGFEIIEDRTNNIWVMIDVMTFFQDVDFSQATIDNDIIRINSESNRFLADIIATNFKRSSRISSDEEEDMNEEDEGDRDDDDDDDDGDDRDDGDDVDDDDDDDDDKKGNESKKNKKDKNKKDKHKKDKHKNKGKHNR